MTVFIFNPYPDLFADGVIFSWSQKKHPGIGADFDHQVQYVAEFKQKFISLWLKPPGYNVVFLAKYPIISPKLSFGLKK